MQLPVAAGHGPGSGRTVDRLTVLAGDIDLTGVFIVGGVLLLLLLMLSLVAVCRRPRRTTTGLLFLALLDLLLGTAFVFAALDGATALEWCLPALFLGIGALLLVRTLRA